MHKINTNMDVCYTIFERVIKEMLHDYSRMTLTDMGMDLPDTQRMIVYSEYTSHCFGSAVYLVQLCK